MNYNKTLRTCVQSSTEHNEKNMEYGLFFILTKTNGKKQRTFQKPPRYSNKIWENKTKQPSKTSVVQVEAELWSADSEMQLGVASVGLEALVRQGHQAGHVGGVGALGELTPSRP